MYGRTNCRGREGLTADINSDLAQGRFRVNELNRIGNGMRRSAKPHGLMQKVHDHILGPSQGHYERTKLTSFFETSNKAIEGAKAASSRGVKSGRMLWRS